MSYEGSTSRNSKYVQIFCGNSSSVYPNMTTSHRIVSGPYVVYRNTFNKTMLRLIPDTGGAGTTGFSYNFQRTLTGADLLPNKSMWLGSPTAVVQRWYPPFSKGVASCDYYGMDSWNTTTGSTATMRIEWEV